MSRARRLLLIAVTLVSTVILLALATWQWHRRAEKLAMIVGIAHAASQSPLPYADPANRRDWARLVVTGRFLHEKTVYIRTSRPEPKPGERDSTGKRPYSGFGVMVMTPFLPDCEAAYCKEAALLINRGFLPTLPDGKIPPYDQPDGALTLTGFLRPAEPQRMLPPYNAPEKGVYFTRDTVEIAMRAGLLGAGTREAASTLYARFLDREGQLEASPPPSGIIPAEFLKAIPNNHASYALTWASLALINLGIAFLMLFGGRVRAAKS